MATNAQLTRVEHQTQASVNGNGAVHIKSPFGYFGSKHRIASQIADLLPPHNAWVEAFCGSAAVTLSKKPAPIEVINDLDNEIVNFFRQLRDNSKELCQSIALTPYSREEFEATHTPANGLSPLERARRFLVLSMMAINGTFGTDKGGFSYSQSFTRNGVEARVSRWYNLPDRLSAIVDRLRRVRIENRDARDLIKMFKDRPATLIYVDPPYLTDRRYGYKHDARDAAFHEDLLAILCKAKCMILVSGYENELYRSTLTQRKGWKSICMSTKTRDVSGRDFNRTEVFWMNEALRKAEKNGHPPIRLTAKEREEKKVNPRRW
jgi:DNA adenine methylase